MQLTREFRGLVTETASGHFVLQEGWWQIGGNRRQRRSRSTTSFKLLWSIFHRMGSLKEDPSNKNVAAPLLVINWQKKRLFDNTRNMILARKCARIIAKKEVDVDRSF
jgi:hypothetical protein